MSIRQRVEGKVERTFALSVRAQDIADKGDGDEAGQRENLVLEFPFSSEEPYLRTTWWDDPWLEVLGHGDGECDLTRLADGAPVLCNHGRFGTGDTPMCLIGATQRAWIENGRGYVEVKLSRRDGMSGLLQDIEDGIVRNVSVGYQILERTLIRQNADSPDEYRVTKWLPLEVSIVDVPADATVGIGRSHEQPTQGTRGERYRVVDLPDEGSMTKGNEMSQFAQTQASGANPLAPDADKIKRDAEQAGAVAERARQKDIRDMVRGAGLEVTVADDLIERGVSADEAGRAVLQKMVERSKAAPTSSRADIETVRDETETRREMAANALLHRFNPNIKLEEGAREFRGLTLLELARDLLAREGVNTRGMDKMQVAARALQGTSDLANIVANVANKSLRAAYQVAPRTFTRWARRATAPDFKALTRVALSDAPALEKVNEHGEFKRGAFTDGKETYQLVTVGKIVGITRQVIVNDDLDAFTRIPALFGTAAANYESDTVYAILTANAALSDGTALFHADHKNLGSGAIAVAGLSSMRSAMRVQKTPQSVVMNLQPRYLIVPAALETVAEQYTSADFVSAKSGDINPFKGSLEVVVEGRLDAASTAVWYGAADPSQVDTVEYAYLEGQEGVYVEHRVGFEVDGVEVKARLDFASKAIDHRGLYKSTGV